MNDQRAKAAFIAAVFGTAFGALFGMNVFSAGWIGLPVYWLGDLVVGGMALVVGIIPGIIFRLIVQRSCRLRPLSPVNDALVFLALITSFMLGAGGGVWVIWYAVSLL